MDETKEKRDEFNYYIKSEIYNMDDSLLEIIEQAIDNNITKYSTDFISIQNGNEGPKYFADYKAFKEDEINIRKSLRQFNDLVSKSALFYLGANPSKQHALYLLKEQHSNALTKVIHEYYQLKVQSGDELSRFVKKWMFEFEVGEGFSIVNYASEGYELKIKTGETNVHLADMGMGSSQIMLLLLRLAVIISNRFFKAQAALLLIEEPELNLHPALQSKLADLFLFVHQNYKLDFLVETHSEYILRRSQVLVAQNEYEVAPNENPFCVHYFPGEEGQQPYQLQYQADGSFDKNFGDGFFDEAASSTLELLKLKRLKKA